MKRKLLMLTLALACLLCLFAVTAAATGSNTPALSINYTNLSFKDSVYIKYAVAAENVAPEDVRLLVFTEPQSDYKDTTKATVLNPKYLDTVNGAEHIIFDFTNLSAKQMTDVVYARAMVEVDGEVYYSNIKKFSILQYADTVIHTPTAKQTLKNMLKGMLDYGALAQTHFKYNTDRPANASWVNVQVVGGTLPDGFDTGMFMVGEQLELIPNAPSFGMIFSHWENSAGERQVLPINAPAEGETYTAIYCNEYECTHEIVTNYAAKAPTCTEVGWHAYYDCDECEYTTYKEIPALGHDEVEHEAKAPACTEIGWDAYVTCSRCDYTTYVEKAALGHDEVEHEAKAPTCTEIGWDAYVTCSRCDYTTYALKHATGSLGLVYTENADGNSYTLTAFGTCTDTEIYIPAFFDGKPVTAIAEKALAEQSGITKIVVGENVTTIGTRAFYACPDLVELTIPASVTGIGNQIANKSNNLTTVYYNSTYAPASDSSFMNQASITHVLFNGTYVPYSILYGCTNIQKITVGKNVKSIVGSYNYGAFQGCTGLTEVVFEEGGQLTSIGDYAFEGCTNLASIEIPDSVTSIGYVAFSGCSSLTNVTFGENSKLTFIDHFVFQDCSSLTSIEIPDSVTSIKNYTFDGCTSLTSIEIPDSVRSIGEWAFSGCTSLASIEIPDSVKSIGEGAFYNCSSLTSIEIPDSVTSIDVHAFSGCTSLASIVVAAENTVYHSDGNCLIKTAIKSLIAGCNNSVIPKDGSVTDIAPYAFSGCTSLASIEIPDSISSIGIYAFDGCTSLASITIPDSVTSIGDYAFRGCTSLASIEIPDSISSIGSYAFYGCTSLTSIVIPDSVTSIGYSAFHDCSSLTSITIPDSVTSIGDFAFWGCTSLASITIPDSVTSIGNGVFNGCSSLKTVYHGGTADDWSSISIGYQNSSLTSATRYDYAEIQPTEEGNWWHYVNGEPTAW